MHDESYSLIFLHASISILKNQERVEVRVFVKVICISLYAKMTTMASNSVSNLIDYTTNITASSIATILCIWLTVTDLRKRKTVIIKIKNTDILSPQQDGNKPFEQGIQLPLHYLSILLYVGCISHSICYLWGNIPYLCQYVANNISTFLFGFNKFVIILFQIQRLELCFGKSYFLLILRIVVCCIMIGGMYYSVFQIRVEFDIHQFYGCVIVSAGFIETVFYGCIILMLDWIVLLTYFVKIHMIKHSWKKLQRNLANSVKNNHKNVSNRLNSILRKILFLSLMMEIPFSLVLISVVVGGDPGSIYGIIRDIFVAIDTTTNTLFLSYMLEYNKDNYDQFLVKYNKLIKSMKCLNCLIFANDYINNEKIENNKLQKTRIITRQVTPASGNDTESIMTKTKFDVHSVVAITSVQHSVMSDDDMANFAGV